jgi:hypothetical protein
MFEQAKKNQFLRAVKHGAFAKMAILPGEDPKEFEELHSALIEEWSPVGPTEEDAVLNIAKGVWRKRRQQKFLHTEIDKCSWDPEHPLFDEARGLRNLLDIMEDGSFLEIMEHAPDHLEHLLKFVIKVSIPSYGIPKLKEAFPKLEEEFPKLEEAFPRENYESVSDWVAALHRVISGVLLQHSDPKPEVLLNRSAEVHTPDVVDHELAVDERIDAMIDRAVKRLVQTKAMKQMLPTVGGHLPKKIQSGEPRDQEKVSTTRTARADSAREPLRGKRSGGGHHRGSEDVRRGAGNRAAGRRQGRLY